MSAAGESSANDEAVSLGEWERTFRPDPRNLVAGMILGVLLLGLGLYGIGFAIRDLAAHEGAIPLNAEKGTSWTGCGLLILFGCALAAGGAALFFWAWTRWAHSVAVYAEGLQWRHHASRADIVRWEEVVECQEEIINETLPILRVLIANKFAHYYIIVRNDGAKFRVSANSIRDHDALGAILRERCEAGLIPWSVTEY